MKQLLPAAALLLAACTSASNHSYTIQGTTAAPDGTTVYLVVGDEPIDSTVVADGAFRLEGVSDDATLAYLVCGEDRPNQFFLEPGKLKVDMTAGEVTGTGLNDDLNDLDIFVQGLRLQMDQGADEDSLNVVYNAYIEDLSKRHVGDLLGLMLVQEQAYEMDADQLDSIMSLSPLYKEDPHLQKYAESKRAQLQTQAGKPYIDVEGVNATSGEAMKLSDVVAQGKPVIVDFWASWCGPCRREIQQHLSNYAKVYQGRCNFVGIAVWENSIDDTRKAMGELPISWPILFAGDRENSPTEAYGITGIPQIMLIGTDGNIIARDLRGEAIAAAIEAALQ